MKFTFPAGDQGVMQRALAERLEHLLPPETSLLDSRGYVLDPQSGKQAATSAAVEAALRLNVVETVSDTQLKVAIAQLRAGAGGELTLKKLQPAKALAAYSSATLALNSFGPFLTGKPAPIAGHQLINIHLEKKLRIGGRCGVPNLDVTGAGADGHIVAIESKCTEQFARKTRTVKGDFRFFKDRGSDPYEARVAALAGLDSPVGKTHAALSDNPCAYRYVGMTQLLKHYLALRNEYGGNATLIYLYWSPTNAAQFSSCQEHSAEAQQIAAALSDDAVTVVAMSYNQVWEEWENTGDAMLKMQVAALRERYTVSPSH